MRSVRENNGNDHADRRSGRDIQLCGKPKQPSSATIRGSDRYPFPRPRPPQPDSYSCRVFRYMCRKDESDWQKAEVRSHARTAARRDRRATGRNPDASECRAATISAPRREPPIAGRAATAFRMGKRRAHRNVPQSDRGHAATSDRADLGMVRPAPRATPKNTARCSRRHDRSVQRCAPARRPQLEAWSRPPRRRNRRELSSHALPAQRQDRSFPVAANAAPDFLVDDVGHFSPAVHGLPSTEGVGHRLLALADEALQRLVDRGIEIGRLVTFEPLARQRIGALVGALAAFEIPLFERIVVGDQ